ncbi:MAG TPA: LPXTG cell wall anchor domain-containing protein [Candidatus Angelobacter sp.]|jgi:LPXTG-motif cell wall-anchored protein|nr:LPXTG cell wall anchor domain-containing protein [Candidatus Angelobacter sp.]
MKQSKSLFFILALATLAFICLVGTGIQAQDVTQPSTTKTTGSPEHVIHRTHVQNAEVIHVSGHDMVLELENGKFELLSLPADFKFNVDGKHLNVHELKPGTKLTQEIHTISTPQEVTTLRTVNGKVWHRQGRHLILSFPDGPNKMYTVPDGIVFNIDGEQKTVFDLRKGMEISATVVRVAPQQTVTTHTVMTGQAPPASLVPFEGPLLIEPAAETSEPETVASLETLPAALPSTGSTLPLAGLLGFVLLTMYAGLVITRKSHG